MDKLDTGVMPIALGGASADGDLERMMVGLKSLEQAWQGQQPFKLHIITRELDINAIDHALAKVQFPKIKINVHNEKTLVDNYDSFRDLSGWWKQQLLKLFISRYIEDSCYITLDADVLAVRPFGERTFLRHGLLVSQWEYESTQKWWYNVSAIFGFKYDPNTLGLSVTPNTFSSHIARQTLLFLAQPDVDVCTRAKLLFQLNIEGGPWTEYSIYTKVARRLDLLSRYHLEASYCAMNSLFIHNDVNIWSSNDLANCEISAFSQPKGYFSIVQSTSGARPEFLEKIVNYVGKHVAK